MTASIKWSRIRLVLATLIFDVREGFVEITRHSLAVIGLAVVATALTFAARPGLQQSASETLMGWLQLRQAHQVQAQETPAALTAAERSTATPTQELNSEQLAVTHWLSRKYKISPEPLAALVSEAWSLGERSQISPTLILAIMAIESRFNPFASGSQGGMGLMQIEPDAHSSALSPFGGRLAAFDPLTNLRIGTRHLQALIQNASSLEDALQLYARDSGQTQDSLYVDKVLAEQKLLDNAGKGQKTALANRTNPL
ncbi:lytic transglycosylase domain-containing protein [Limnohabitans sp.]|uniref:lytic transglycosylase domain-containing protein n=1 Tax=Limnohabitans sp. TaxID=1907725 RepID=UPI0025C26ECF|nr:lytic transglycosylase domain-containing protein [Limnohabitans sp.]